MAMTGMKGMINNMNRKESILTSIKSRLPRFQDSNQKKALANISFFFALMLVLTLVARGTAAANMPVVTVQRPAMGEIVQRIKQYGTVKGATGEAQQAISGITVDELLVSNGQAVKSGDAVVKLNLKEITQELDKEQVALQKLQLRVSQLTKQEETDRNALMQAQQALAWAREDFDTTVHKSDVVLDETKETYLSARDTLEKAKNALAVLEKKPDAGADALKAAREQVAAAQAAYKAARDAFYNADSAADAQLTEADRSVIRAENTLEQALDNVRNAEEQAKEQADTNALEAKGLTLDVKAKKVRIEGLKLLKESKGVMTAPKDGTVRDLSLTKGQKTTETPSYYIADDTVGYLLELALTEKQAKLVKAGTKAVVTRDRARLEAIVQALTPKGEDGTMTATLSLPKEDWRDGEQVQAEMEISRKRYDLCLPISAVHSGSDGDYVLVIDEQNTILGLQNVLRKMPVTVEETDDSSIAVTGALFTENDVVITGSRPVESGDRVRIDS